MGLGTAHDTTQEPPEEYRDGLPEWCGSTTTWREILSSTATGSDSAPSPRFWTERLSRFLL